MKQIFIALLVLISATCYGQTITEGAGSTSNNRSVSKLGFRIPQVNALTIKPDLNNYTGDSASGALVYCKCIADTSKKGLYFWRTDRWVKLDSSRGSSGGGGGTGISQLGQGYGVIIVNDSTYDVDSLIFVNRDFFYNKIDSAFLAIASDSDHIVGVWPVVQTRSNDTIYTSLDSSFMVVTLTDGIKDGGYVSWTGTRLSYDRSPVVYVKNQVLYSLGATQFTLPDADPTYDRFDVPGVDTDPGHILIEGEAEAQPQIPQLPNPATQLTLNTAILVSAGDTIPAVNVEIIYDQDSTNEWTHTTNGTVGFTNTDNPRHLTIAADMSSYVSTRNITFTRSVAIDRADYTLLKFYVDLKGDLPSTSNITVRFYNGSTAVTGARTINAANGFTKVDVGYQTITVPLSSLAFSSNTFNRVVFSFTGANPGGLYLDWVQLQGNINPGGSDGTGTVTIVTATNTYGLNWVITNPETTPNLRATIDTSLIVTKGFFYNSISNTVDSLAATIPAQFNPIAGTNISLTGTYPNITFNASGSAGSTEYVVGGFAVLVDSAARVYTINVDNNLISSKEWFYDRIDSLVATLQPALNGTGYVKMSGTTPSYQSNTQLTADVNAFTQTLSGAVPAPTTLNGYFLKDDGTWAAASGGGAPIDSVYLRYNSAATAVYSKDGGTGGTGVSQAVTGNIGVGFETLLNTNSTTSSNGMANVAIGYKALKANTTGDANVAIGYEAMTANLTGVRNFGLGRGALAANTTGDNAVAIGYNAMNLGTDNDDNVAIGSSALDANTGNSTRNVAIGSGALGSHAGTFGNNVAVGYNAMTGTTAARNNTVVGALAGGNYSGLDNTAYGVGSGGAAAVSFNAAYGSQSLTQNTGTGNTGLGYGAGESKTSGNYNTALGYRAGFPTNPISNAFSLNLTNVAAGMDMISTISGSTRTWQLNGTGTKLTATIPSATLSLTGVTGGFLTNVMTKTERDAISSPAIGLMIYQTDNTPGIRVWNGTNWMRYTETAD